MNLNYLFLFRFFLWSAGSVYLFRTALVPRNAARLSKLDRSLRFLGAIIMLWLAIIAMGRAVPSGISEGDSILAWG
jgi:hypothetical protein